MGCNIVMEYSTVLARDRIIKSDTINTKLVIVNSHSFGIITLKVMASKRVCVIKKLTEAARLVFGMYVALNKYYQSCIVLKSTCSVNALDHLAIGACAIEILEFRFFVTFLPYCG